MNFTPDEYYYIYETFVWPQSIRVPHESLKSVSNILKIFSTWSARPRYYPLFVVRAADFAQAGVERPSNKLKKNVSAGSSPLIENFDRRNLLDVLFELVDSPQCSTVVVDFVIDMVHNMVSFADFVEEDEEENDDYVTRRLPFKIDFVQDQCQNESSGK